MSAGFDHKELATVAEVGRHALAVVQRKASAEELLESLRALVPFEAAHLSYRDPVTGLHEPLTSIGYAPDTLAYLTSPYVTRCPAYRFGRACGHAARMRDIPFDFYSTETYLRALGPAGYEEGVTLCLRTGSGHYTGMLTMNTVTRDHPTDRACEVLDLLGGTLAQVTDAALTPAWLSSVLEPGNPAIAVTEEGGVIWLSPEPAEPFVDSLPAFVRAARGLLSSPRLRAGCYVARPDGWHVVQIVRAPAGLISGRPCAVVTAAARDALPHGLTARELDVLTMMATGAHNREIADVLVTSPRTVSTHVEHILDKLGCASRTAAAARAIDEGIMHL
jgi:DNA-binding CsgD family transcriptional regulator